MPLDPKVQSYLTQLASLNTLPLSTLGPEQARLGFDASAKLLASLPYAGITSQVQTEDMTVEGAWGSFPVRVYRPLGLPGNALPLCVFFHGGGFVLGDIASYDHVVRAFASAAQCVMVSVDYHKPPEYKFPIPVKECFTALQWAREHARQWGSDPERVFVAGDSAGGNFAAVAAQQAKAELVNLAGQILFYPTTDMLAQTPSKEQFGEGFLLTGEDMAWFGEQYLSTLDDAQSMMASPGRSPDFRGLAPAFIITAEYDPLRDEGEAYAGKLREAGVPVTHKRYNGMIHGFVSVPAFDQASRALREAADFIQRTPAR